MTREQAAHYVLASAPERPGVGRLAQEILADVMGVPVRTARHDFASIGTNPKNALRMMGNRNNPFGRHGRPA